MARTPNLSTQDVLNMLEIDGEDDCGNEIFFEGSHDEFSVFDDDETHDPVERLDDRLDDLTHSLISMPIFLTLVRIYKPMHPQLLQILRSSGKIHIKFIYKQKRFNCE